MADAPRPRVLTRLSTRILIELLEGPVHGYGILKELDAEPDLEPAPKTGSLYLAWS